LAYSDHCIQAIELNLEGAYPHARVPIGPRVGLEIVDTLTSDPALEGYHLLPTVRGDFLFKLVRLDEARPEFERDAGLTRNARARELPLERAATCARK